MRRERFVECPYRELAYPERVMLTRRVWHALRRQGWGLAEVLRRGPADFEGIPNFGKFSLMALSDGLWRAGFMWPVSRKF